VIGTVTETISEATPPDPQPDRPWHFGRYLVVVLLVPILTVLLTLPFAGSQVFLRISRRNLWHATHYRYVRPPEQNCDVVIAGDSSGMTGVDPHVIASRTGWTTCNLALPYIPTALAGTRVLDDYLAHNRPPRFIVFHFSNNHLRPPALDEDNGIVDGWLMVEEHFPFGEKLRIFATHPLNTLRFVAAVWKEFVSTKPVLRPDWSGASFRNDMAQQEADNGWLALYGTTPDLVCAWQAPDVRLKRSYLDGLLAQYSRNQTRAVLWANPARDCDDHIPDYQRNAKTLGLPPTAVYDRTLFSDAYHLNTEGAAQNSEALSRYLQGQPAR
jgi:hypothetical protein